VEYIETNAIRTLMQNFGQAGRKRTVRNVAKAVGIGGGGPVVVGAPAQVVDGLLEWVRRAWMGSTSLMVTPGSFEDFVEGVVPVLQQRG
jgi:alkanesulfonate monooxygenase SsuD/methylene tetrahydromethanopterin reductase-like flavin-dependent oxidoreductase (luciferase family)